MRLLLASLLVLLVLPATAGAAEVRYLSGPEAVVVTAAPGEVNQLAIGVADGLATVTDSAGLRATTPCVQQAPTVVTCPGPDGTALRADLGDGDDRVTGGDGDDVLDGGAGTDVLRGGAGLDVLRPGDSGTPRADDEADDSEDPVVVPAETFASDVVDGGTDTDEVVYTGEGDLVINLKAGTAAPASNPTGLRATLIGIEDAVSADGDDTLVAGRRGSTLEGHGGKDEIHGSAADDRLFGGPGEDAIEALAGDDELHAGSGHDTLFGGPGDDSVSVGRTGDYVELGAGDDAIVDGIAGRDFDYDVRCGPGEDAVALLRPTTSAKGCESLLLGGALTMELTLRRTRAQVWETRIGCARFNPDACGIPNLIALADSIRGKPLERSTWPRRRQGVLRPGQWHVLRFPVSAERDQILRDRRNVHLRIGHHIGVHRFPRLRLVG